MLFLRILPCSLLLCPLVLSGSTTRLPFDGDSPQIMVDQFGFLPEAPKVAIFADPVEGFNRAWGFKPGGSFEVRRVEDDAVAYAGELELFNEGQTDPSSGDRVWWADFSSLEEPGTYYVADPASGETSHPFEIGTSVYVPVLKAAGRMYYYNRSGIAKEARYAGKWTHGPNHPQARKALFYDTEPRGRPRDVSGGWWDAGDYNKYSRFTTDTLFDLFMAYEGSPDAFPDTWNIPESGNDVPDILDEIRWELDWLLKMQDGDSGGVHNIAGTIDGGCGDDSGDPAKANLPWYYTSVTTWSTASFAAITAHASRVMDPFDSAYATRLLEASKRAWTYLEEHPEMFPEHGNDTSNGKIGAGDSVGTGGKDLRSRIWAAAELYHTTGEDAYEDYFLARILDPDARNNGHHPLLDGFIRSHHGRDILRALLAYRGSPDPDRAILGKFHRALHRTAAMIAEEYLSDGYRNDFTYYWWGSNMQRAFRAHLLLLTRILDIPATEKQFYHGIASEYLNYLHGRNPLNIVYLTNMGPEGADAGAERSVEQIFHYWFSDGSIYDGLGEGKIGPAPGYLPGGPNQYFEPEWINPPFGQPPGKSFLEFNTGWEPQRHRTMDPWAITEPAIYYQAAYLRLLAPFVNRN